MLNYGQDNIYQFPKRVIFADGNMFANAAGTFPEKAGSTEQQIHKHYKNYVNRSSKVEQIFSRYMRCFFRLSLFFNRSLLLSGNKKSI